MLANMENSAVAAGLEKVSFHSNPKERQCQRMLKLPHNCTHLMGSHRVGHDWSNLAAAAAAHASNVMLKILQNRLQHYVNHELSVVQAGFRKGRGTRDQIANICWIMEKARKTSISSLLTRSKPLCGSQTLENSSRDGNTGPPDLPLKKSVCRSGSNS